MGITPEQDIDPEEPVIVDGISYKAKSRALYSDRFRGIVGWVCQSCGVIVGDGKIHSRWHNDGAL